MTQLQDSGLHCRQSLSDRSTDETATLSPVQQGISSQDIACVGPSRSINKTAISVTVPFLPVDAIKFLFRFKPQDPFVASSRVDSSLHDTSDPDLQRVPSRPPGTRGLRSSDGFTHSVGIRLAELGASGRGQCSLVRRPAGLRKEVATLKSFSKTSRSLAKSGRPHDRLALTPLTL